MHISGGFSKAYREQGVQNFYTNQGANYSNPHRYDIERLLRKKLSKKNPWITPESKILDLACGSGQITTPLISYGYNNIKGTDPFTQEAYKKQTKKQCDTYSFMDIIEDCYESQKFDCIVCSYAMHLVKQSLLHDFCNKLSEISRYFIIISPHKFPIIKQTFGWSEIDNSVLDKIHFRVFKSYNFIQKNQENSVQQKIEQNKSEQKVVEQKQKEVLPVENKQQQTEKSKN